MPAAEYPPVKSGSLTVIGKVKSPDSDLSCRCQFGIFPDVLKLLRHHYLICQGKSRKEKSGECVGPDITRYLAP